METETTTVELIFTPEEIATMQEIADDWNSEERAKKWTWENVATGIAMLAIHNRIYAHIDEREGTP